jgi:hypothetical protein
MDLRIDSANKDKRIKGRPTRPALNRTEKVSVENYSGIFEPSVAQPPLPLQEFLPLQPLSLDLQPPLPLQEFWPLQACFSLTFLSVAAGLSVSWAVAADFSPGSRLDALMLAPVPASKPATAAPVSRNLFDFVMILKNPHRFEFNCIPQAEVLPEDRFAGRMRTPRL